MAASITLGSVAVAANGKTVTATCSGGTGPYTIANANGLLAHLSTGNTYGFPIASVSMSSPTLTINLTTPIGSGEVLQLDVTAGSATLGDAASNTAAAATNTAVTNNSTVTVTTLLLTTSYASFELGGAFIDSGGALRPSQGPGEWMSTAGGGDHHVEFVTDATEVAFLTLGGATTTVRVDGGSQTTAAAPPSGTWAAKPLTTSALAAGKHLFLVNSSDYMIGVRLSGGTRTMYTVPTAKAVIAATSAVPINAPSTTSVTTTGARQAASAPQGSIDLGSSYHGAQFEFQFTGTGVEISALLHQNTQWAASVDSGYAGQVITTGSSGVNNTNGFFPLAVGQTNALHSMSALRVGAGGAETVRGVRVINGTKLSSSTAISATTFQVPSTTHLAVNDWVKIDRLENREWRQITNITGSGPYTVTVAALAIAHAAGVAVTSFSAAAGSVSATPWTSKDRSVKRVVGFGDSNTQGANELGFTGTPDANGVYYTLYDPRQGAPFRAADAIAGYEFINLGIQGTDTIGQAARVADMSTYTGGAFDYILLWCGVNDINGNTTTQAQFSTNVQTMITAAAPLLRASGKIVLVPPFTPNSTTSAKGLNIAGCASALQTLAAANPSTCVYAANALSGVSVATHTDGASGTSLHYNTAGRTLIGANLRPYLQAAAASVSSMLMF